MSMLADRDRERVREMLAGLTSPVRILFFTQTLDCESCLPTRQILDEIVPLSDQLSVEEYNFLLDKEKVAEHRIEHVPAIAIVGDHAAGTIRYYGMPAGYEFMSLLEAIRIVGTGASGLSEGSRALVAAIDRPTDIQVFVTPG